MIFQTAQLFTGCTSFTNQPDRDIPLKNDKALASHVSIERHYYYCKVTLYTANYHPSLVSRNVQTTKVQT